MLEARQLLTGVTFGFDGSTLDVRGTASADSINIHLVDQEVRVNGIAVDLVLNDLQNIRVSGGGGDDYINLSSIETSSNSLSGLSFLQDVFIAGGAGSDTIIGSRTGDRIFGGSGEDRIFGQLGDDLVYGGRDNDTIYGGRDNDRLFGELGEDRIFGELGTDTIRGGANNDIIRGGQDVDFIFGESGDDTIFGEGGDDVIQGNRGNDTIRLGNGFDNVVGGLGVDTVSFQDATFGVAIDLDGNSYTIGAGAGSLQSIESVLGSNHDDTFFIVSDESGFEGGAVSFDGGDGTDTLDAADFQSRLDGVPLGVKVDLAAGTVSDVRDGLVERPRAVNLDRIENIIGTPRADILVGDENSNVLEGRAGNDRLIGNGEIDTLLGEGGDDILLGGDGADILRGGDDNDTLNGQDGADSVLDGGNGNDTLSFEGGPAVVASLTNQPTVNGTQLNVGANQAVVAFRTPAQRFTESFQNIENLTGSASADVLVGDDNNNVLRGLGLGDIIAGLGGVDTIDGGTGDDILIGGESVGFEPNLITGGDGKDTFVTAGGRFQAILDFGIGQDEVAGNSSSVEILGFLSTLSDPDNQFTFDNFIRIVPETGSLIVSFTANNQDDFTIGFELRGVIGDLLTEAQIRQATGLNPGENVKLTAGGARTNN